MKNVQRTLTAALAATALVGAFSLSANAQPAPAVASTAPHATAHQHGASGKPADFAQHHAQRSEHLKTILQLQPNQQAAWDKYVQATTPDQRTKPAAERADLRKLTTPERLDQVQKLRKERTAKAEQREQATRSFYASLTSSQQKAFDAITAHPGQHHKTGQRGQRMGHPHGLPHNQGHHSPAAMPKPTPASPAA